MLKPFAYFNFPIIIYQCDVTILLASMALVQAYLVTVYALIYTQYTHAYCMHVYVYTCIHMHTAKIANTQLDLHIMYVHTHAGTYH